MSTADTNTITVATGFSAIDPSYKEQPTILDLTEDDLKVNTTRVLEQMIRDMKKYDIIRGDVHVSIQITLMGSTPNE